MFQSEEIAIAPHYSTSALQLIKGGAPLEFLIPVDKAIGNDFRIHLVKNAPHRALAEKLINQSLTPAAAECLAEKFNAGPPIAGVKLRPEVARYMPWGPNGSIANLSIPDWRMINAKREELTKKMEAVTRR
jgi:putative spermidine/putrescine transport system substrate-binding protein